MFKYVPMVGAQIAFRDFTPMRGMWASPWVGIREFVRFFESPSFWTLLRNTFRISALQLSVGFLAPVVLALAVNEVRTGPFKRTMQLVTYAPHFISTVVVASMIILVLSPRVGLAGNLMKLLNVEPVDVMGIARYFPAIYVASNIWQHAGFAAIIYMAALSGVNPELYEAARVDGASRLQKIRHIDIPGILPTIIILLILEAGEVMNIGFEKIYLLQNPLNLPASEIIATYVYKLGIIQASFSFAAAVGLFNGVVNFVLLFTVNALARRFSDNSLW